MNNKVHGEKSLSYMPGVDGLRALAVFAVIAYHLGYNWASGGLLGVNLFFVLSGYLITNNLFIQWNAHGKISLKQFWLRRAKRLLPALFLMITTIAIAMAIINPAGVKFYKGEIPAVLFYVENWYLIFREVSYFESFGPVSPLGHLWSLAIEEQFYILWPLILTLLLKLFKKQNSIIYATLMLAVISATAMAVLYLPGADPSRVYYGTDTRAFALLIGSATAMIFPRSKMSEHIGLTKKASLNIAGMLSLISIITIMVKTNQYQPSMYRGGLFAFSILAAFLVVFVAHPATFAEKLMGITPLRLIGKWSYGIYLWHYPIIVLTKPVINTRGPGTLLSLLQIAISIILAALSYYILEEPVLNNRKPKAVIGLRAAICLAIVLIMTTTSLEGMQSLAGGSQNEKDTELGRVEEVELGNKEEAEPEIVDGENGETEAPVEDSETETEETENTHLVAGQDITIISDSLLMDAKPLIEEELAGITINTKKGRQMYDAPEIIKELTAKKKIGKIVVIALGSNGAFTEKQLIKTIESLDDTERILLVNTRVPRPWENAVNETIEKVAEDYPKVKLVNWYDASRGHDEYFYKDGVHLNRQGMAAYLEMLLKALET